MYLEKLEISGFKSFASKNKLIFSGIQADKKRGLTAIVGPNGSGKSNVADSIRWVLGEQSAKTLRAKKGEDVIFSGSDKKGRLGMAEVSLYLNNQEKTNNLKKDLLEPKNEEEKENDNKLNEIISTCDEIIITRRLYRNGDSEYLINNSRSRLTDIQMLLAKANFGQKTYSVIGQGMVENFLTASASERKDFFDEATGIKQFQIKRDSAINKLEASYENLQQVDMLLTEVKPRLKSLTRQVEKLKKRENIEVDLKNNQINYYKLLWNDINLKLNSANSNFLNIEKNKIDKDNKLSNLNDELNKLRNTNNFSEINEFEPLLKEKENNRQQILKQLTKLQVEMETKLEAQGQFDISWLNNKQSELEADLKNLDFEISSLEKTKNGEEELNIISEIKDLQKQREDNKKLTSNIYYLKQEIEKEENQITRKHTIIDTNLEIEKRFDINKLREKKENYKNTISSIDTAYTEIKNQQNTDYKKELEQKLNDINREINQLNNNLNSVKKRIENDDKELKSKDEIENLIDDFLNKLDEINKENDISLVKKLIAEAKDSFRIKIKALISGENLEELENLRKIQESIINSTEKKQEITAKLGEENLRLDSLKEKEHALEEKKQEINNFLREVQGDLNQINVNFDAKKLELEIQESQIKIKEISQEIEDLNKKNKRYEIENDIKKFENLLQEWKIKESSRLERLRLLQSKKISLNKELDDIKDKLNRSQIKFDAEGIKKEEEILKNKLNEIEIVIKEFETKINILSEARNEEKNKLFDIQKNSQLVQNELNILNNQLNSIQIDITRQETRLENLESSIRIDELNISEIETVDNIENILDEDKDLLLKKINNAKNQLDQIGGIDPEVEKEFDETKTRYDFLSKQTNDLNKAIDSLEEIITELDKTIKKQFDIEFKVISEKFAEYFKILFNGGMAKISKIINEKTNEKLDTNNEENAGGLSQKEIEIKNEINNKLRKLKQLRKQNGANLEGIEIQAIPPGKKIQTVTMLSGGERALTAIALICAIISANPSPFVVLDEVDAALDEANSERLAKILDDLSDKTQFIVITHNRASMKKASILYGVTMQADGVSKLLSVKIDDVKIK